MRDDYEQRHYTGPPRLDEEGLIAFLRTQPDIVAAYLFGSLAQGRATPRSDIDIAILLTHIPDLLAGERDRQFELMDAIERFTDRKTDVVILNTAPPLLQIEVLSNGRRLYEGNPRARIEFEVRAGQIYADLKPMYDFFTRDLFQKIKEVGLGGRRRHRSRATAAAS